MITSFCLFCGSRPGHDPGYVELAASFGSFCAEYRLTLAMAAVAAA